MKHGSLFSGYGGLDLAVDEVFGSGTIWHSEIEPGPSKVLAHRFPGTPNLGDITQIDWAAIEAVDIMSGGSPCQDLSSIGLRAGMRSGTRSGLWESMVLGVSVLRPQYVVWENVKGALSAEAYSHVERVEGRVGALRALGRVLGDLASLGYDAAWGVVRASDAGAPHQRERVFVLASDTQNLGQKWSRGPGAATQAEGPAGGETAADRWARAVGRRHPDPLVRSTTKFGWRLNPYFSEWMMGLPEGWVVNTPDVRRTEALKMLGNGVVPQQATLALRTLLEVLPA